jgi:hypothetical protein
MKMTPPMLHRDDNELNPGENHEVASEKSTSHNQESKKTIIDDG